MNLLIKLPIKQLTWQTGDPRPGRRLASLGRGHPADRKINCAGGRCLNGSNRRPGHRGFAGTRGVSSGPGGLGEFPAGRGVLFIRHQLRRPGDRKLLCRRPVQCCCRYLFGVHPGISRPGDRVYRAAGNNCTFRRGWRFDGHLGRGHNPLRR